MDNGSTTSIINVSPTSTTGFYLTVTDEHGCQATAVHSVIVNKPDLVLLVMVKFVAILQN